MSEFKKVLDLFDATALVVGIIIGSGIFLTTGIIAQSIPNPLWILLAWLVGGLISAAGALTMAQLAGLCPQSGGVYIYLREAFGPKVAFAYGWTSFLVLQCGSIAALAVGFALYLGQVKPFFGLQNILYESSVFDWKLSAGHLTAMSVIAGLTFFNYRGTRLGSIVQNFLTVVKVVALVWLISLAFWVERPHSAWTTDLAPPSLQAFAVAMIAILWTFSGWFNLNFAAEEVQHPSRNIPLALMGGIAFVTVIYCLVNYVYLTALPLREIKGVETIGYKVFEILLGPIEASLLAILVMFSILGTLNGLIFASPRAYFAMARDNIFAGLHADLHPVYHTPHKFLALQAAWSFFLVISGSYMALFTYVMFAGLFFLALSGVALFVLHRRSPQRKLFCHWCYPVVPAFFVVCFLGLACNTLWSHPLQSSAGIALILIAMLLHPEI